MRMGFGELSAVRILQDARIDVCSTPGLRAGIVIVDHDGYIFTPTALYLEAETRPDEAPNAMRLSRDQVTEALSRLSPAAKAIAVAFASSNEERERINEQAVEVGSEKVASKEIETVEKRLKEVPPVKFDVARQVRVYSSYLQYVEIQLSGAAIQRKRLAIPESILKLGSSRDLNGRLKTTFDLIQKDNKLSSKALENELNAIRKNFTRSLGKNQGRVILKAARPKFEERLKKFRDKLNLHQQEVQNELQNLLDESRNEIIKYYRPRVVEAPPDSLLGGLLHSPEDRHASVWIDDELDTVFPDAECLIRRIQLNVRYKDVTFETLDSGDFLDQLRCAFPRINWDKAHDEFQAAAEY